MTAAPMPAELELALRQITPTCNATRIRTEGVLLFRRPVEEPCRDEATHAMHVVCDGPHQPFPTQLVCREHVAALEAMQGRGQGRFRCQCGGTVTPQLQVL